MVMKRLKISVVITTYNRKYEVSRALRSVLGQTIQPFEIIIVDDGSTDGTREYLQNNIQAEYKYIYNVKTKGPGRSRNIGMVASQGDYIAFLDSDNEWYPDKLQSFCQVFEENSDIDVVCSKYKKHIEFGAYEYPGDVVDAGCSIKDEILLHNIADASASIYRKAFLEKIDGFNESMTTNLDWELLLRANTICSPAIYKMQDTLSENWEMGDGLSNKAEIEISERMIMLSAYWKDVSDDYMKILFYKQYEQDHIEYDSDYLKKIGYYKWVGYDKDWMKFEYEASVSLFHALSEEVHLKDTFYTFLLKWIEARQKGITIADVLKRKNIDTVAIYGFGIHGHLALKDLVNSQILVKYMIDQDKNKKGAEDIDVLDLSSEFPEVDAIIISPFLEFESIAGVLMAKTNARLMSLQDLVFEASNTAEEK